MNLPAIKASRTYPQPDAPELGSSPRNRALAVFKYLLNLEPERASGKHSEHPLFKCIEHAFVQEGNARMNEHFGQGAPLKPSLIERLADGDLNARTPKGPTEQDMRDLLKEGEPLFADPTPAKLSQRSPPGLDPAVDP